MVGEAAASALFFRTGHRSGGRNRRNPSGCEPHGDDGIVGAMIPAAAAVVLAQVSASLWIMIGATAAVAISAGLGYRTSMARGNRHRWPCGG
jgi:hypothetical protein